MNNLNNKSNKLNKYKIDITTILIAVNIIVFIAISNDYKLIFYLGFYPDRVISNMFLWQFFTYMFVHSPFNPIPILFNMLGLFIFGRSLEKKMGSGEFLIYYFVTGIGAVILFLFLKVPIVGASGVVFAILLAFATYFPNKKINLLFVLPIKAPVAVLLFAGLSLLFQFVGSVNNIVHLTNLTGILIGFIYFVYRLKINPIKVFKEKD
jgi:membrane associated rhomboid family serine protease